MINNTTELYRLEQVSKSYAGPSEKIRILENIDLSIQQGESIAIVGASGSGKSTLLHILGSLDNPSSGKVYFQGKDLNMLSSNEQASIRNKNIGFVFQFHHLLPEFNTLENVAMQALIGGMNINKAKALAKEALELVGLEHRLTHNVTTLSGGERQRAAIARAILLKPKVLLADEPTGNLDIETGGHIAKLLLKLNEKIGMTLIVVTHNQELAVLMQRHLEMKSRRLI
ncbi:ABC transporter ATP-binding protein [Desulfovibrio litoralis]|uniref:Lipoprotein-releasing system ATP-binding protein n=1 Tax=Desulfovibrio litoralis DSM 11393 TaxID=1121455 RepID=A0A1M7TMZ2_9BACT|nr:ABC transporter ATP-binding protein [Desulfovibrio litoralis]SHN72109.1 lipoprotein-releasing system ATP-binding protein [Desulfovibrio litoralis DSM 11393]